ncbi:kinase-regulated stress-responsive transcription factor SKN7 ASCRUDRAFT_28231, partial [Ascoidea rubescens DSM 1968]
NGSSSNDFVKKLFQMLEITSYKNVVCWTRNGDSFIVLDTNQFTKEILPKHFKHSNFASFVRQLNKYDFHKVKLTHDEKLNLKNQYNSPKDTWEFKHPDFKIGNIKSLENIKRKGPNQTRKSNSTFDEQNQEIIKNLIQKNSFLEKSLKYNNDEIKKLNNQYRTVLESLINFKNITDALSNHINILVDCLKKNGIPISSLPISSPIILQSIQLSLPPQNFNQLTALHTSSTNPTNNQLSSQSNNLSQQKTAAQNSSFPFGHSFYVLLVEDDAVCIQLCRKFLIKYGCTVHVVTDGLAAISTVETNKYDLVLMDIIMPNLDGASATSFIRNFDKSTPIIAMTGNIGDNDLANYLRHGMSDILAKPFTKDDLYLILQKHL